MNLRHETTAEAPAAAAQPWFLYLLECAGGKLYAGISPDPQARFLLHQQGKGARYTRANPPLRILAVERHDSRSAASSAEHRLKQLRRPGKLAWAQQRALGAGSGGAGEL